MSRIVLVNQSSTPDDAGSGNAQLFVEGNELFRQVGTSSSVKIADQDMITTNSTFTNSLSAPSVSAVNTCKVWLNYDHHNDSLKSSFNVSSVNDDSAGNFTINFAIPFANSEYVVTGMGNGNNVDGNSTYAHYLKNHSDMATGSVKIVTQSPAGSDLDLLVNCIAIHGN